MNRDNRQLPPEFLGTLNFNELVQAFASLVGESLSVRVTSEASTVVIMEMFGILTRTYRTENGVLTLQFGDYAYVRLDQHEIERATLCTMDGNYYFRICVQLAGLSVAVADLELQGLETFAPKGE